MAEIVERDLSLGEFRRIALEEARRQLLNARDIEESAAAGGFVKRTPPPLIQMVSQEEIVAETEAVGREAVQKFPQLQSVANETVAIARRMLSAPDAEGLLSQYRQLLTLYKLSHDADQPSDRFDVRARGNFIHVKADAIGDDPDGAPASVVKSDRADHEFVAAVANLIAEVRRAARPLTQDEHSAVLAAYRLLDRGVQVPSAYRSIGVSGFREHQTCLSVANPGDGHIRVMCSSARLLSGTVIHIEHIDRDGERDREKLEPYRLPAALNAARVRLHAGVAAPCTAYVGRPVFESGRDMLKSVHMTASACTSMFMNGIADCKVAIERMTTSEAIRFMRAVAGNAVRDATRQYLSGAFNVNLPIVDDRAGTTITITEKFEIARLGIDLAVSGRFEKVTWDGASNVEPSIPIVEQLTYEQLIDLVHIAHEKGLETYISAGLQPIHMRTCTYIGVDGVGIGTSLHDYNPESGLRGQLKAERVREVLDIRDAAAHEPLGRGAALLARMDRMYFEGTLPLALDSKRRSLYSLMRDRKDDYVVALVEEIGVIPGAAFSDVHPLIAQAHRVLKSLDYDPVGLHRDSEWETMVTMVRELVVAGDVAELYEVLP